MSDIVQQLLYWKQQKQHLTRRTLGDTVGEDDAELIDMITKKERKLIAQAVQEKHPNKITSINISNKKSGKSSTYWQTNAPWTPNGKLRKASLDDLYSELFEHYYGHEFNAPTTEEIFKRWMSEREELNSANYLTRVHNQADWDHFFAGKELTEKELKAGKRYYKRADFLDIPISEVKASQIIRHYKYLIGDDLITKKAFTNAKTVINGVFSYAAAHDIPCINPYNINTKDLQKRCMPEPDNSDEVFSKEERAALLTQLEAVRRQTVATLGIRLAFCIGARIGELRALHWEDYDQENRILHIHRQMTDEPKGDIHRAPTEKMHMKGRNSNAGKRTVVLSDYAVDVLEQLKQLTGEKVYILNARNSMNPITLNQFNINLKTYCEKAGIRYRSSHKIRFGAATSMYDAGVDERSIKLWLGHSSISTTRHYDRRADVINISDHTLQDVFGNGNAVNGENAPTVEPYRTHLESK